MSSARQASTLLPHNPFFARALRLRCRVRLCRNRSNSVRRSDHSVCCAKLTALMPQCSIRMLDSNVPHSCQSSTYRAARCTIVAHEQCLLCTLREITTATTPEIFRPVQLVQQMYSIALQACRLETEIEETIELRLAAPKLRELDEHEYDLHAARLQLVDEVVAYRPNQEMTHEAVSSLFRHHSQTSHLPRSSYRRQQRSRPWIRPSRILERSRP